jgi:hypothetical protein
MRATAVANCVAALIVTQRAAHHHWPSSSCSTHKCPSVMPTQSSASPTHATDSAAAGSACAAACCPELTSHTRATVSIAAAATYRPHGDHATSATARESNAKTCFLAPLTQSQTQTAAETGASELPLHVATSCGGCLPPDANPAGQKAHFSIGAAPLVAASAAAGSSTCSGCPSGACSCMRTERYRACNCVQKTTHE